MVARASPQANGQVERVNKVIIPMLAKLSDNVHGKFWYHVLSQVEFAINNTVNRSIGVTPSKMLFGTSQKGRVSDNLEENLKELNEDDKVELEEVRKAAEERIVKSQNISKNYYDRKRRFATRYSLNQYVMVRNFDNTRGVIKKLIPRYRGPYRILKVFPNNRYLIGDVEDHQVSRKPYKGVWEAANMRPYYNNQKRYENLKHGYNLRNRRDGS